MPANPSSPEDAEPGTDQPMSRAERRAAARAAKSGKGVPAEPPSWSTGKVAGSRGIQSNRRSYSNRRSGG